MRKTKLKFSALIAAAIFYSLVFFIPKTEASAPLYNYNYDLISQSAYPSTLEPGSSVNVYIEVKNTGDQTWRKNGSNIVRLGSGSVYGSVNQSRDYISEFANIDWLSANRPSAISGDTVLPGEITRFQFNIKAPNTPGVYKAYFTPVVDGHSWMKDIGIYWQIIVKDFTESKTSEVKAAEKSLDQTNNISNPQALYSTNDLTNIFAPSVVKIICKASVNYWNQGSGTLFRNSSDNPAFPEYYITTNLHVIQTEDGSISNCDIKIFPEYENNGRYLVFESQSYKSYGENLDFAILEPKINSKRINAGNLQDLTRYAKNNSDVIKKESLKENIDENLLIFGYPENGFLTLTQGSITGSEFYNNSKYIDTFALLRHGNSGGLAVNSYGQILGIPTFIKGDTSMILDLDYLMGRIIN